MRLLDEIKQDIKRPWWWASLIVFLAALAMVGVIWKEPAFVWILLAVAAVEFNAGKDSLNALFKRHIEVGQDLVYLYDAHLIKIDQLTNVLRHTANVISTGSHQGTTPQHVRVSVSRRPVNEPPKVYDGMFVGFFQFAEGEEDQWPVGIVIDYEHGEVHEVLPEDITFRSPQTLREDVDAN